MSLESLVQTLLAPGDPCSRQIPIAPWGPMQSSPDVMNAWSCYPGSDVGAWINHHDSSGFVCLDAGMSPYPFPEWPIAQQCETPQSVARRLDASPERSRGLESDVARTRSVSPIANSEDSDCQPSARRRQHPGDSLGGPPTKDDKPTRLLAVIGDATVGAACSALQVSGRQKRAVEVQVEAGGEVLLVQYWDSAEMDPLSWLMLGADAVIFVYDVARRDSFHRIEALLGTCGDAAGNFLIFIMACGGLNGAPAYAGGVVAGHAPSDAGAMLARRHAIPFLQVPLRDGWDCAIGEALAAAVAGVEKAALRREVAKQDASAQRAAKRRRPRTDGARHAGSLASAFAVQKE